MESKNRLTAPTTPTFPTLPVARITHLGRIYITPVQPDGSFLTAPYHLYDTYDWSIISGFDLIPPDSWLAQFPSQILSPSPTLKSDDPPNRSRREDDVAAPVEAPAPSSTDPTTPLL
jgi:hypothetical protein